MSIGPSACLNVRIATSIATCAARRSTRRATSRRLKPKTRKSRAHWKRASLLLEEEVGAAALTQQVQAALVMDGKLDPTFERISNARRWPGAYKQEED